MTHSTGSIGQQQEVCLPSECWFIWYIIYQYHCFCWQTAESPFAFRVLVYYIIHDIPATVSLFLLADSRKSICVQSVGLYNTLYCASYNVTVSVGQKQKACLPSKCWFIIWYIIYQLQCHCFCWRTAGSLFAFKVLVYYIIHDIPATVSLFLLADSRKSICVQSVGLYNTLYCASYNVTVSVSQKQKACLPSKCWFIIWYIIYQLQCHCFCWRTAGSLFAFKVLVYYMIHDIPATVSLFLLADSRKSICVQSVGLYNTLYCASYNVTVFLLANNRKSVCLQSVSAARRQQGACERPWCGAWYPSNLPEPLCGGDPWCWGWSADCQDPRPQRLVSVGEYIAGHWYVYVDFVAWCVGVIDSVRPLHLRDCAYGHDTGSHIPTSGTTMHVYVYCHSQFHALHM